VTFDQTRRLLESWVGRDVTVSFRASDAAWNLGNISGRLRPGDECCLEEGTFWTYKLRDEVALTGFILPLGQFRNAFLEEGTIGEVLVIEMLGATLEIEQSDFDRSR
jgi:hypothetical protein